LRTVRAESSFLAAWGIRVLPGVGPDGKAGFLRRMSGMQMDEGDSRLLEPVTERIIGCAFRVANALGHGFVESVAVDPSGRAAKGRG
jgi:hypothetical protein